MQDYKKIDYSKNKDVVLRYIPGHFITPNSHVNYYMDLTDMKSRQREARATGEEMADMYLSFFQLNYIYLFISFFVLYLFFNKRSEKKSSRVFA